MNLPNANTADLCRKFRDKTREHREAARKKLPPHQFEITEREGEMPAQTLTRVREITDLVGAKVQICWDQVWVGAGDAETLNAVRLAL